MGEESENGNFGKVLHEHDERRRKIKKREEVSEYLPEVGDDRPKRVVFEEEERPDIQISVLEHQIETLKSSLRNPNLSEEIRKMMKAQLDQKRKLLKEMKRDLKK